ncbi:MAG: histidine kinase [Bacteroidetes bacterium]|nr:histidine kinase [Bacteroidota bacterium]
MIKTGINKRPFLWEFLFQLILLALVFSFYSFDREETSIELYEVAFFLNYAVAACIINYLLLPRFLYQKKYVAFILSFLAVIALVIYVEEGILEKIFFPDTRGLGFPGVIYNLVGALPTISILTGFKFAWDALTKQREVEQLQSAVRESEMQFLKSQINPHFLFNNLNNLYSHALEESPKTPEIILELSGVLRYMLYECQEKYVPLSNELEQLRNFINLSRLQFEGRGEVIFHKDIPEGDFRIAPLILPVFVENAFKHSLSSQSQDIYIKIEVTLSPSGHLQFTCENTFSEQTNTDSLSKGIGLQNVQKRLGILYPDAHKLDIDIQKDIYSVSLQLDLKTANKTHNS